MKNRYTIDYGDIQFVDENGYDFIDNPDHPNGTLTDHGYFLIHNDLFDIILATDQNNDITLKFIPNDV